ncbi:MAG: hypothetical protein ACRD0U_04335 [Acidimicrobiales bacterium]
MSYALFYDVPADKEMYRHVKAAIGDEQPKRLVVHLVVQTDGGLRHIGVWESQADWQRFHDERVEPAVHAVLTAAGFTQMPPDPPVQDLDLVDVWIGSPASTIGSNVPSRD